VKSEKFSYSGDGNSVMRGK